LGNTIPLPPRNPRVRNPPTSSQNGYTKDKCPTVKKVVWSNPVRGNFTVEEKGGGAKDALSQLRNFGVCSKICPKLVGRIPKGSNRTKSTPKDGVNVVCNAERGGKQGFPSDP